MGQIRDIDTDVYDYFLTKDKAVKTFNPRIMDSTAFLGPVYPADDKSDGSPVTHVLAGLSGQYFSTEGMQCLCWPAPMDRVLLMRARTKHMHRWPQ
jgi:hypothetical protein